MGSTLSYELLTAKTDCQWKVEAENKRGNGKSLLGAYVPQCKEDGSYEKKQCHGSTGYCWCVDEQTGKEITGTKKGPGQGEVECPSVANVSPSGKISFLAYYFQHAYFFVYLVHLVLSFDIKRGASFS